MYLILFYVELIHLSRISLSVHDWRAATYSKPWTEESLVNFISEAKSVIKQDVLIMVRCPHYGNMSK